MMRRTLLALAAAAIVVPKAARAEGPIADKLAPAIENACQSSEKAAAAGRPRAGVIEGAALRKALFEAMITDKIKLTPDWMAGDGADYLAGIAFELSTTSPAEHDQLGRLTLTWLERDANPEDYLPYSRGGILIVNPDGSPVATTEVERKLTGLEQHKAVGKRVFAGILRGDSQFTFLCQLPVQRQQVASTDTPASGTRKDGPNLQLGLVRKPGDLGISDLSKRSYAEIAWLNDRDAKEQSYSIYGTLGLSLPDTIWWQRNNPDAREAVTLRIQPTAFAQLEYEGGTSKGKLKQTDNLNFGLQISGLIQPRSADYTASNYFTLNARYLSDTRFRSSAWSINGSFIPGLRAPGFDTPKRFMDDRADFRWLVTGVADHVSVTDPGTKAALLTSPEFTRVGLDLTGALRFFVDEDRKQALALSGDYYWRETLGGGIGNAQRIVFKLQFEPDPHIAFGIAWDKGENLDSLEHSDTIKVTLGLRR